MKKLLSICFLSMLLGLLSFSVSAQNDNGCKSGFWIENLQPDTVYGVVNMPPDGKLPLSHTLGHFLNGSTVLPGNATIGNTELYELHFCNTCGLDQKTKVSIDWVLLRKNEAGEWVEVNDQLSRYADFGIYTFYNELNQYGECQSIRWLGGRVFDGFGYCDDQSIGTGNALLDTMMGVNGPCYDPTNYPGAMHVEQGTPMAVLSQLGQIVPAAGQVNIYSQNHDYFYLDFFEQTRNIVVIKWKQVGDYKLVMRVRQRLGGTPWTNEHWNSETDYVGGHQSCCGPVLVEDTIYRPDFGEACKEVCEGESYIYGRPPYTFNVTMPDTNVVFGDVVGEGTDCAYFDVDSVNRFHFFVRETPEVQAQDITICKCTTFGQEELNALVTIDDSADGLSDVRLEWSTSITGPWSVTIPTPPTEVGTYTFYVRQTNIYQTCPPETLECTGPAASITLTINELPAPTGNSYDICNESGSTTKTLKVSRTNDVNHCSTTSVWFLDNDSVYTGDSYKVTLADIRPETNVDKVVTYHVYAYNATTNCYSAEYAVVTVTFHQTPEIQLTYLDVICPHAESVAFNMSVTSAETEFPYTVNQTSDFAANVNDVLNDPNYSLDTYYNKPYEIEDFVCNGVYHLYYKVTDANGCFVRDTATFIAKDSIAPEIIPATWQDTFDLCDFEGDNRPDTIKTLEGFDGLTIISDDCGIDHFTCTDSTYVVDTNICEKFLKRTYTFYDYCNNASTFTQTFVAHDNTKPHFATVDGRLLHERLNPKRGMNCTYNSLSKDEFVLALLGKVFDECMDYDFQTLKDHSDFYFEESSTFGHVLAYDSLDIFRTGNGDGTLQIQIEAHVTDNCGNLVKAFVFYFNEPKKLEILHPSITVNPDKICLGESSDLSFDASKIVSDVYFELAEPLSYSWTCANPAVNFIGDTNLDTVKVTPTEAGTYVIYMTVADAYGCTASDSAELVVKAAPNIVIVPIDPAIGNPPYCPNVGHVTLGARDAADPTQVIPGLTYHWTTSQAVDIDSETDTTQIYVEVLLCKHDYDAQVHVVDTVFGCEADAEIIVPVEDKPLEYLGHNHYDTAQLVDDCKMIVTDFTKYVIDSLYNPCGAWSPDTMWQVPEEGTVITENTAVTVYVVSHCSTDTLVISDKFMNIKYSFVLEVFASAEPASACEPATFTHSATTQNAHGPVTYTWTQGTTQVSTAQSFSKTEMVAEGEEISTYVYQVEAVDSLNCRATDRDTVTVYKTVFDIDTLIEPNTHCERLYNGRITLLNMPEHYKYELFMLLEDEVEVFLLQHGTNNPQLDGDIHYTSIVFDTLVDGNYRIRITTDKGCESEFDFTIERNTNDPVFNEVDHANPTHCSNDDGFVLITPEEGFAYYVLSVNEDGESVEHTYTMDGNVRKYGPLTIGEYQVYKEDLATHCIADTTVTIDETDSTLQFNVDAEPNTICGDQEFNGTITLTKLNDNVVHFVITKGDFVTELDATELVTTVEGLAEGTYEITGTDMTTNCVHTTSVEVENGRSNPVFEATPNPNHFCDNDANLADGSVTLDPATGYTYNYYRMEEIAGLIPPVAIDEEGNEIVMGDPADYPSTVTVLIPIAEAEKDKLAAGTYLIEAIDENGCVSTDTVEIENDQLIPQVTVTPTENSTCDTTLMPYTGQLKFKINNFSTANKPYTITVKDSNDVVVYNNTNVTSKNTTVSGLGAGDYTYVVTDKYFCFDDGEVEIEQEQLDSLKLKQTPNTFCYSTVAKPGNGTITVMPPYDDLTTYSYALSFAPVGMKEKGDELEVHIVDLSPTIEWLYDTIYYVTITNLNTGCDVADTITVLPGRDTLELTGIPTPNKNCQEPYDGQIELTVTYKPYQFDYSHIPAIMHDILYPPTTHRGYAYSITDSLFASFQVDNVFTGLKDSTYYFYVMDTITRCIYKDFDSITVEKLENDITIDTVVTPNHACVEGLYDGTITATASSEMFDPAEFEYSFNDGEFSEVNTWNSLAPGVYHIVAREINSGCENFIDVEITTKNECTPEIDVDVRKYCLNEENATITATAILPEDSDCEGDFTYRWHKECHNEYFDGPTAPVATDEEMCCFYTVTATNTVTGCEAVRRVEVCVYATHTIQYTVDYEPIAGNSTTVCENEDLTIGVVHNGWAQAWWTMNHVTDTTVINPEYEFYVNTPDSVAAYVDIPNKWKYNKNVTFCLDVIDTNGCPARGLFNLVINPLVRLTNEETVCELPIDYLEFLQQLPANMTGDDNIYVVGTPDIYGYDIDPDLMAAIVDGTVDYPYSVSRVDTIPAVEEGCDTILTTILTVVGYPTITGAPDDFYCEGTTIGEVIENITITNADEESIVITLNGEEVTEDDVLTYNPDGYWLNIYCYSYADDQTQYICDASVDYDFSVGKKPDVEVIAVDTLCAGWEVEIDVPEYECNSVNGCTVDVIMVDSTDADNVIVTVLEEDYQYENYLLDPIKLSYNGKYIGFKVANECDDTTVLAKLIVDTVPVGTINTNAICANQKFASLATVTVTNADDLLNPDGVQIYMYVKKANDPDFVLVDGDQLVDYTYDGAQMYAVLVGDNQCGEYTTETVTITVSDKPTIVLYPDPFYGCNKDFDEYFDTYYCGGTGTGEPMILEPGSPDPEDASVYVLPNGSEITEHGWLLLVENEDDEISYQPVTVAQIKELAYDSTIQIKYYAKNACGADTVGPFDISITDEPELTVTTGTICPTSSITDVITYTVDWHSDEGTVRYVAVKEGEDNYEISAATTAALTFEDVRSYNGGEILVIAENTCGADTEHVALNIPTFDYTEPVFQPACVGSPLSAFIATAPTKTITVATIVSEGWYKLNATPAATEATEDEAITLETIINEPIQVYYKWVTSCGDEFTTDPVELQLLTVPTVSIEDITICEGSTIDLAVANLTITADESTPYDASSITWTVNGEPYDENATYTENGTITVTIQATCAPVTATANIIVNPVPEVELEGPEKVCDGTEVTFVATPGFDSYTFTLDDGTPVEQTSNEFVTTLTVPDDAAMSTSVSTVTVTVTDQNGCNSSNAGTASVVVSSQFGFTFTDMEGHPTHEFTSHTSEGLQYIWMVNDECKCVDTIVWVEYEFYHNGVALTNESPWLNPHSPRPETDITNFIHPTDVSGTALVPYWITKNELSFQVQNPPGSLTPTSIIDEVSYYYGAAACSADEFQIPVPWHYYGNHFPYTQLNLITSTWYYDDFWMHFLADRPITQTVSTFLADGDYTIVFKLYSTSFRDNIKNGHIDVVGCGAISPLSVDANENILIGGRFYANGTPTLLAVDSIHISVTGPGYEPEEPETTPSLAPEVTVEAEPDMEVWPNPAPAVVTTLKARVHNMSGEATVTLTNLSGKQLYADKINIDSDNYYFEFGVNNLSVGSYVMTVRTGDAIITKKVVVSALAQ